MNDSESILIVEDEQQIREAVAMALECEGFRVIQAGSAGHATVQAASRKHQLVRNLPGMSPRRS